MVDDETVLSYMGFVVRSLYRVMVDQRMKPEEKRPFAFSDYCSLCHLSNVHIHFSAHSLAFFIPLISLSDKKPALQEVKCTSALVKSQMICSKRIIITKYIVYVVRPTCTMYGNEGCF